MPVHAFNTGDVLTAADVNAWLAPLAGVKSSNQSTRNNSLINDADLRIAMAANSVYEFRAFIRYSSGTGQDFKQSMSVPASAYCRYQVTGIINDNFGRCSDYDATDSVPLDGGGADSSHIYTSVITGCAWTGGTAGNLIYQWAQLVTGDFDTTVYAHSYLTARRIG